MTKITFTDAAHKELEDGRTLYVIRNGDYYARFVEDSYGCPLDPMGVTAKDWLEIILALEKRKQSADC